MTKQTKRSHANHGFGHEVRFSRALDWNNDVLGDVEVTLAGHKVKHNRQDAAFNQWAEIILHEDDRPEMIKVRVKVKLAPGVRMIHVGPKGVRAIEGKIPDLNVKVEWTEKGPNVIFKDANRNDLNNENDDLLLYNELGGFVLLEYAVVVRYGKFILTLQESYAGQLIFGTKAAIRRQGLKFCELAKGVFGGVYPLWERNAYPGADFLKTWMDIGRVAFKIMHKQEASLPIEKTYPAEWNPTPIEELGFDKPSGGRIQAYCGFFNIAWGAGALVTLEGKSFFVHFTALPKGWMSLQPMEPYEFSLTEPNERGQRQVHDLRPLTKETEEV